MIKRIVKVIPTPKFEKLLNKAPRAIKRAYRQRFNIFLSDPFHPLLHNHLLTGNYKGYRSINITGDWRVLYKEVMLDDEHMIIEFHLFGTHSQLYR